MNQTLIDNLKIYGCVGVNQNLKEKSGELGVYEVFLGVFDTNNLAGEFVNRLPPHAIQQLTQRVMPVFGELEHPDLRIHGHLRCFEISLENAACQFSDIEVSVVTLKSGHDVQVVSATMVPTKTPSGKVLQNMIDSGITIEFGYRSDFRNKDDFPNGFKAEQVTLHYVVTFDVLQPGYKDNSITT